MQSTEIHEKVAKAINADIYFAKPYGSYQRGTNENTNGVIRRTWANKMSLGYLTAADVRTMEGLLNTMFRKVLEGRTPIEVYTAIFRQALPMNLQTSLIYARHISSK